jgi:hypothetical protein
MKHRPARASAAAFRGALALALTFSCPADAEPQVPATWAWHALADAVPKGSTVIVRTRDGKSAKGRVSSLSDTAIVLEGGRVKSFPAADVVTIEGGREGQAVKRGATVGLALGATFGFGMAVGPLAGDFCHPEERVTWSDAMVGAVVLPATFAGIGAALGLAAHGTRTLVYRAEQPLPPAKARVPVAASWDAVPRSMTPGGTVVVKTRDGRSTKGRLRDVSATAIVVESRETSTIPAADVASIEDWRGGRSQVKKGAVGGAAVGAVLALMVAGGAMSTEYCDCDDGLAAERALAASLLPPVIGAGIGAGIGLMVPGRRAVVYRQPVGRAGLSLAPIAGRGQRGVTVRAAF